MKHQGEWDWDGVFEARVRNGVEASISEAALFGSAASKPIAASNDPVSSFGKGKCSRLMSADSLH